MKKIKFFPVKILFLLFFFCRAYPAGYPVIALPADNFSRPSGLLDNTTHQLKTNFFYDNSVNQKNLYNETIFNRDYSELLYCMPEVKYAGGASLALGVDRQNTVLKILQPADGFSASYLSEINRAKIIFGKKIGGINRINASLGIISGYGRFDYALEGVTGIDEDNKIGIAYSKLYLPGKLTFSYKSESIDIASRPEYSNSSFSINHRINDTLNFSLGFKLAGFNPLEGNSQRYRMDMSGNVNSFESLLSCSLKSGGEIALDYNQETTESETLVLSNNLKFGKLDFDCFYYNVGLGKRKSAQNGKYEFSSKLIKHQFKVDLGGYLESWPFTPSFAEFIGEGKVANFSDDMITDIYELQVTAAHPLSGVIDFRFLDSLYYVNTTGGTADIFIRKSSIIGLTEPPEYLAYSLPRGFVDSYFDKIKLEFKLNRTPFEVNYAYEVFFPVKTGGPVEMTTGEAESKSETRGIPGVHRLSFSYNF